MPPETCRTIGAMGLFLVCMTFHSPEWCPNVGSIGGSVLSVHSDLAEAIQAADDERDGECGRVALHGADVFGVAAGEEPELLHSASQTVCPACELIDDDDSKESWRRATEAHAEIWTAGRWYPPDWRPSWAPAGGFVEPQRPMK